MIQRPRAEQELWNMPGILHIYRVRGVAELFALPQRSGYSNITASCVTSCVLCYSVQVLRSRTILAACCFNHTKKVLSAWIAFILFKGVGFGNDSGKYYCKVQSHNYNHWLGSHILK